MWKFILVQKYDIIGEKKVMYYNGSNLGFVKPIKYAKRFDTYEEPNRLLEGNLVKQKKKGIYQIEKIFIIE